MQEVFQRSQLHVSSSVKTLFVFGITSRIFSLAEKVYAPFTRALGIYVD
jgi:hypothetical protein